MERKILKGLEKLARINRMFLWERGKELGITPLQLEIINFIGSHPPEMGRVGVIAREIGVAPPTITDAVKTLIRKGLLKKKEMKEDKRKKILYLTRRGEEITQKFSRWEETFLRYIQDIPYHLKSNVWKFLLQLILRLQKEGIISPSRICFNCENFMPGAKPHSSQPHLCLLTGIFLAEEDMEIECKNFKNQKG